MSDTCHYLKVPWCYVSKSDSATCQHLVMPRVKYGCAMCQTLVGAQCQYLGVPRVNISMCHVAPSNWVRLSSS